MTRTDDPTEHATDHAMTRSEERLVAGTTRHATGRVRLQKFVTTEMVTVEVPVRREEVRLVHEPLGDDAHGGAVDDVARDVVVVLHEERPVVGVEVVPVERVRLVVDTVTTTETVSGVVRAEHVELDGDAGVRPA